MWDLPEHFPIGVDSGGNGPAEGDDIDRTVCCCGDVECGLHLSPA
jgi:hypothetical protein